jgi:hypothetical protein
MRFESSGSSCGLKRPNVHPEFFGQTREGSSSLRSLCCAIVTAVR